LKKQEPEKKEEIPESKENEEEKFFNEQFYQEYKTLFPNPEEKPKYNLANVIFDFELQKLNEKKFCHLIKLVNYKRPEKYLLGLYGIKKKLEKDDSLIIRKKIVKGKVLEKSAKIFEEKIHPDFDLVILRLLTSFLNHENSEIFKLHIQQILLELLFYFFSSEDSAIVCYSVNLVNKLARKESKSIRKTLDDTQLLNCINQVLEIDPQSTNKEEHVVGVKYKCFNDLLGSLSQSLWADFALTWILFTCDILTVGFVRDHRCSEYENWLISQKTLLKDYLIQNKSSKAISDKAKKSGTIFFLFFIFKDFKADLLNIGLRKVAQKVVMTIPGTGL
jgi:hypothetical protein